VVIAAPRPTGCRPATSLTRFTPGPAIRDARSPHRRASKRPASPIDLQTQPGTHKNISSTTRMIMQLTQAAAHNGGSRAQTGLTFAAQGDPVASQLSDVEARDAAFRECWRIIWFGTCELVGGRIIKPDLADGPRREYYVDWIPQWSIFRSFS
jgi:hypothetical protein